MIITSSNGVIRLYHITTWKKEGKFRANGEFSLQRAVKILRRMKRDYPEITSYKLNVIDFRITPRAYRSECGFHVVEYDRETINEYPLCSDSKLKQIIEKA